MKSFNQAAKESTCLKRVTVCEIYSDFVLLARESNRCEPPNGECSRLGLSNAKSEYPSSCSCSWKHAEIRAIAALPSNCSPELAIIFGHDFPCPDCEGALRKAGVKRIAICPDAVGCGLRKC